MLAALRTALLGSTSLPLLAISLDGSIPMILSLDGSLDQILVLEA